MAPELGSFDERRPLEELAAASDAGEQRVALVNGNTGPKGLVELRIVMEIPPSERGWMRASDAMVPFAFVEPGATLGEVAALLDRCGVSQVPVLSAGALVGWIGDRELRRALLE